MKKVSKLFQRVTSIAREDVAQAELRPEDRRDSERVSTYKDTVLFLPGGQRQNIIIHDASETGIRIGCSSGHSLPDYTHVVMYGLKYTCRVVWRDTFQAGLQYVSVADKD